MSEKKAATNAFSSIKITFVDLKNWNSFEILNSRSTLTLENKVSSDFAVLEIGDLHLQTTRMLYSN